PSKEVKDGLRLYECLGQGLRYLCSRHTFEPLIKSLSLILQKELEEYQRTKTTEEAPSVGLVNILAAYTFVIQSCRVDKVLSVADTLVKVAATLVTFVNEGVKTPPPGPFYEVHTQLFDPAILRVEHE